MKRILTLLLIASLLLISGCETFRGLGKDLEKGGEWMQDKAKQ
jgi:predicted small secreted protein